VVEGRYDVNALAQTVDALFFPTDGFGIFSDRERVRLLRRLGAERGLILLTDSDPAGFLIRNHLKGQLTGIPVKHAYIPQRPGKERRKRNPSRAGLLGVEGMDPNTLLAALEQCGATFEDARPETPGGADPITKADLYALGLSGRPDSARRRAALLLQLDLPSGLSANSLLAVLNTLYTRDAFLELAASDGPST